MISLFGENKHFLGFKQCNRVLLSLLLFRDHVISAKKHCIFIFTTDSWFECNKLKKFFGYVNNHYINNNVYKK